MVRTRPPRRLDDIVEAALVVFETKGYQRARMADVAREAGVSPALLYTYAVSKEALFHLVLLRELGAEIDATELPIPNPTPTATARMAKRALAEIATIPTLNAALKADRPIDAAAELAGIVGDHYDRVHRYRRFIRVAERSARDWPDMAERIYADNRQPYISKLGRYIAARVDSGHFKIVRDADVAARFVIETVAWFAMHRFGDHDGAKIDDHVARDTVIQLVTDALVDGSTDRTRR